MTFAALARQKMASQAQITHPHVKSIIVLVSSQNTNPTPLGASRQALLEGFIITMTMSPPTLTLTNPPVPVPSLLVGRLSESKNASPPDVVALDAPDNVHIGWQTSSHMVLLT